MATKQPRLNVVLDPKLYQAISKMAQKEGLSMSLVARDLLKAVLFNFEDPDLVKDPGVAEYSVKKTETKKGQYVVDLQGHLKAVLINMKDYKEIMRLFEDKRDVQFIHRHQHEKLVPMGIVHRNLKK